MLRIALKPSRYLCVTLSAAHLGALALLVPLEVPFWTKAILATSIVASLAYTLVRHALLRGDSTPQWLDFEDAHHACIHAADGASADAEVLGTTYVSPSLTVLNLRIRAQARVCHVLIAPDSTDPESARQLRVLLRWGYRNVP